MQFNHALGTAGQKKRSLTYSLELWGSCSSYVCWKSEHNEWMPCTLLFFAATNFKRTGVKHAVRGIFSFERMNFITGGGVKLIRVFDAYSRIIDCRCRSLSAMPCWPAHIGSCSNLLLYIKELVFACIQRAYGMSSWYLVGQHYFDRNSKFPEMRSWNCQNSEFFCLKMG